MERPATEDVPELSVVVPVFNEADNVAPLIDEIRRALDGRVDYQIVYVDDGSDDATAERLRRQAAGCPRLTVVRHAARCGQSAAIASGVKAARAPLIATLDGDGQNDPADIPGLLAVIAEAGDGAGAGAGAGDGGGGAGRDMVMVAGNRADRRDPWPKRVSSRIANRVRGSLLGDGTLDTGCGLKVFSRAAFLDMPRFDHMHRFLPALMLRRGGVVISVDVHHRPRRGGISKYGVLDRLWIGIVDLLGVMWLQRRGRVPEIVELEKED